MLGLLFFAFETTPIMQRNLTKILEVIDMPFEKTTRETVKQMWDALLYHCMEMSKYMSQHATDPFFQTEFGKKMMQHMVKLTGEHAMGCIDILAEDFIDDENEKDNIFDLENLLKKTIDNDDGN